MEINELKSRLLEEADIRTILTTLRTMQLKDCWLCAGSVRNFIWNGCRFDPSTDVDVIFFDPDISYEETQVLEASLRSCYPDYRWELKNQVFMHIHNPNTVSYQSAQDAIVKFPERCTAIGIRLLSDNQLEIYAPFGLNDLYDYRVRPTPYFEVDCERMLVYRERLKQKTWLNRWPQLAIEGID